MKPRLDGVSSKAANWNWAFSWSASAASDDGRLFMCAATDERLNKQRRRTVRHRLTSQTRATRLERNFSLNFNRGFLYGVSQGLAAQQFFQASLSVACKRNLSSRSGRKRREREREHCCQPVCQLSKWPTTPKVIDPPLVDIAHIWANNRRRTSSSIIIPWW